MNGTFDINDALAFLITSMTFVVVIGWPLLQAAMKGTPMEITRGLLLTATGTLFLLRARAAVAAAGIIYASDLSPTLFTALVVMIFSLAWIGCWLAVLPGLKELGESGGGTSGWLIVIIAAAAVMYSTVFIVGPLPGHIASRSIIEHKKRADDAKELERKSKVSHEKNAVRMCSRLLSLVQEVDDIVEASKSQQQLKLKLEERIKSLLMSWDISPPYKSEACSKRAAQLTPMNLRALDTAVASVLPSSKRTRATATEWDEVVANNVNTQATLGDLQLQTYFSRALTDPIQQIKTVFSTTDLATSAILLGEFVAMLLWGIDLAIGWIRQSRKRQAEEKDTLDDLFEGH